MPGFKVASFTGRNLFSATWKKSVWFPNTDRIAGSNCKRAMSLHFLPPTKIKKVFLQLKKKVANLKIGLLDKFFNYIGNTWLQTGIRSPEPRSAFFQIIRTNNDAEGWHNKLNTKGKGAGLNFYKLFQLLFSESEFVQVEKAYLKLPSNQSTYSAWTKSVTSQTVSFMASV